MCPLLFKKGYEGMNFGEWGMAKEMNLSIEVLQDLQVLFMYMLVVDWETYVQNTFNLSLDIDGCPIVKYPSQIADSELVDGICVYFDCKHGIDITKILRPFAMHPLGDIPEGISYDVVDVAADPCDDDNILEVNKP
jgi:hypothetical protein